MPYSSNADLPKAVRSKLSSHQQDVFRNVFNSMMSEDGMTESRAFAGAWSQAKQAKVNKASVGDKVSWNSSGGTARGIIRSIHTNGEVPNIPVKIEGSDDDPAAKIELLDEEGKPRGEFVGHKVSTLSKADVTKAMYQGKEVSLDKPFRLPAGSTKKFGVYVKDGDKVKKVTFGDPNMEIRRDDPKARANFRARHSCDTASDKTSARYWSCRFWSDEPVSDITKSDESVLKDKSGYYHYLYKTTNKANGKYYYGIHSTKNLDDGYLGSGVALKAAINKYGKESFEKEVLEFFPDRDALLVAEMLIVDESVVKSSDTYNVSLGGMSYVDSLKCLSEEDFIHHQSVAGKLGGKASYSSKTDIEKVEWHKAGRAASSGSLGKKIKIKDLESYKEIRKTTALKRPRYYCPHCDLQNLDGGNLKQHLAKVHNDDGFEVAKKYCRMWEDSTSVTEMTKSDVKIEGQILKQDSEERLVYGWAYVSTDKGEISLDHSGEFVRPDQIAKAATNFMLSMRTAKRMHSGGKIGEVVHSMPLTNDITKALGIQSDREGWLVAIKVYDDQVWQDVKSGKLAAFSIGGKALKELV